MKIYWPTFDESMRFSKNYVYHKKDLDKWKFIEDKYNEILNRPTQKQKIPKILHQVWLGDSMPNREIELCSQVKKYLPPDWQYKLWRNEDLKVLTNFTQKELSESKIMIYFTLFDQETRVK
jgi:mannosyltransferase OCH1-like enzyme